MGQRHPRFRSADSGFGVSDEAFYKDGLRLKGTDFITFLSLDPYGAERLEVLRGPASVLYGQNNPGGIISYISKRPTDETFREIEISAGSFDRYQGQFDMGGKVDEAGVLSYRLTGLFRDGDTDVDFVNDDRIFFAPSLKWQPDADTSLTLLATYQRDTTGWGFSSSRPMERCSRSRRPEIAGEPICRRACIRRVQPDACHDRL
jgi:iron complex outermembrane recepter protein